MAKLTTIEGIGPAIEQKLQGAGIKSIESLLEAVCTKAGREKVSSQTNIEEKKLLRFANHADLMRIKGVGGEYSELLEAAGVDSCTELAQRNSANLVGKMNSVNAEKKLVRQVPSEKQVAKWIQQSKRLKKVVTH